MTTLSSKMNISSKALWIMGKSSITIDKSCLTGPRAQSNPLMSERHKVAFKSTKGLIARGCRELLSIWGNMGKRRSSDWVISSGGNDTYSRRGKRINIAKYLVHRYEGRSRYTVHPLGLRSQHILMPWAFARYYHTPPYRRRGSVSCPAQSHQRWWYRSHCWQDRRTLSDAWVHYLKPIFFSAFWI